jgi:CheY-like chemotaxis protein
LKKQAGRETALFIRKLAVPHHEHYYFSQNPVLPGNFSLISRYEAVADSSKKEKSFSILMIDDDEEDFLLVEKALETKQLKVDLFWAQDGDEAMNFLFRRGAYSNAPAPELILLDLNMPGKSGFEVLKDIKGNEELRKIPVVILTSSRDRKNVSRVYNAGANSFMLKPMSFDELANAMESLCQYWFAVVQLPNAATEPVRKTVKKAHLT